VMLKEKVSSLIGKMSNGYLEASCKEERFEEKMRRREKNHFTRNGNDIMDKLDDCVSQQKRLL